ncbi:hypothetical protein RND71_010330 [Anisodus tanguticus]|uniref:Uncharacterized protein n=1 Tax=Anisodus tanguticus TaxID=243964 RepID=A0AAE1VSL0_9SOLA|nr:hypothetical protein RND71_010330 [Anisodus tanguticus]
MLKLLAELPILFFVLSQIRRVAVEALDSGSEVVYELCRRFKLVYKYHCAAEDEKKKQKVKGNKNVDPFGDITQHSTEVDKKRCNGTIDIADQRETTCQDVKLYEHSRQKENHLMLTQDKLVDVIRRVSCDSSLDSEKKSHLMQSLLMRQIHFQLLSFDFQWILTQNKSHSEGSSAKDKEKITGQCPSFGDKTESVFGCKHYKRNCKLLAPCCNELFPCIRCHDEITDHCLDRCKWYGLGLHIPLSCNLCRLGKGLGIGYFHCMTCNACMSKALSVHTCREKFLEDNCLICHEDIFTSASPVKALPCGHVMHSTCFQVLDAYLSEEKLPEEYAGQIQELLPSTGTIISVHIVVHTIQGLDDLNSECRSTADSMLPD